MAAEASGFDGVGLSEHHGGFPGYVPTPTLVVAALLAVTSRVWGAACPTVLPMRSVPLLVEDLAWLNAAFPGRVGVGLVSGYQARDFEMVEQSFDTRRRAFAQALPEATEALRGEATGPLGEDPAVLALRDEPIPVLAGVGGRRGAVRAARAGAGLLLTSMAGADAAHALVQAHQDAGGSGSRVLIRRVWLGPPSSFESQMAAYRAADPEGTLPTVAADDVVIAGSEHEVTERLVEDCRASGVNALNLRVFSPDADNSELVEQILGLGATVLPPLRRALGWSSSGG
jgi:alkanesulfonate monooxygenase SsuD/methylene tetrahydromethanopterin reductase-like flavin-dependent oxidoreductase (luciferase family)